MVEAQEARAVQTGGAVAASAPPPLPAGWSGAAMAVHAVRRMPAPMLVTLQPAGRSPIVIDMRAYVYAWDEPLDALPVDPEHVQIGTRAIRDAEPVFAGDDYVEHAPVITGVARRTSRCSGSSARGPSTAAAPRGCGRATGTGCTAGPTSRSCP